MSADRAKKLVEAGVWLRMSGDQEGARRLFEHALKLDPANGRARQLLEAPTSPQGQAGPAYAPLPDLDGAAQPTNPFLPGQGPSRSIGLEVDWGLAAILPESQGALRPTPPPTPPPGPASAWDSGTAGRAPNLSDPILVEPGAGSAMDLLNDPPPPAGASGDEQVQALIQGAIDLMGLDDHSGPMDVILKAQQIAPDHPEVRQLRERSERTLLKMYESKLGQLDAMPRVLLKQDEVIWLNVDHRAGFVLAQIDGAISFEDLFAVSGMSRLDTARILVQLKEQGVISVA